MKTVIGNIIKQEMQIGELATLQERLVEKLLPIFEGQTAAIEKLFPENQLLKTMIGGEDKLKKRMQEALMVVWQQLEEGVLVAMDPNNIKDFVFMMNIVQGAIVEAQGGHRGKRV